jgi:Exostosin family
VYGKRCVNKFNFYGMARTNKYLARCLVILVVVLFAASSIEKRHYISFGPVEGQAKNSSVPSSDAITTGSTHPTKVLINPVEVHNKTTSVSLSEANTSSTTEPTTVTPQPTVSTKQQGIKFFLVAPPEVTTDLVSGDNREKANNIYTREVNEFMGEVWLHRGFERMTTFRVHNPEEADAIIVAGYLHLNQRMGGNTTLQGYYEKHLNLNTNTTKGKPHLFLFPSINPVIARSLGGIALINFVKKEWHISNIWSVSYERNPGWVGVPLQRMVPIPYNVKPTDTLQELRNKASHQKLSDSIFYAGDARTHAIKWASCNRSAIIAPLQQQAIASNTSDRIDVRLMGRSKRLTQEEYNQRMLMSEYCLILCGDTPTSRSLASAMVAGCIPIRVGSRLRGLCEPPCKKGYGWVISGENNPHLPFSDTIPWDKFPEVPEKELIEKGKHALDEHIFGKYHQEKKTELHSIMQNTLAGWIYGWGNPLSSEEFGDAVSYIWHSFSVALDKAG